MNVPDLNSALKSAVYFIFSVQADPKLKESLSAFIREGKYREFYTAIIPYFESLLTRKEAHSFFVILLHLLVETIDDEELTKEYLKKLLETDENIGKKIKLCTFIQPLLPTNLQFWFFLLIIKVALRGGNGEKLTFLSKKVDEHLVLHPFLSVPPPDNVEYPIKMIEEFYSIYTKYLKDNDRTKEYFKLQNRFLNAIPEHHSKEKLSEIIVEIIMNGEYSRIDQIYHTISKNPKLELSEPINKLLEIFYQGNMNDFKTFVETNKPELEKFECFDLETMKETIQLFTLCDFFSSKIGKKVKLEEVKKESGFISINDDDNDDDLDDILISGKIRGLMDFRIDEEQGTINITFSTLRGSNLKRVDEVKEKMSEVRDRLDYFLTKIPNVTQIKAKKNEEVEGEGEI